MSYNTKCLNANNSSTATANATSTAFDVSEASIYGGANVDEKPPAPPVRLASARAEANNCNSNANSNHHGPFHNHHHNNIINNNNSTSHLPLDMRPLPKAPEEDKKALKKSKLRSSMKRSGGDGSSNGSKGASGGQSKDNAGASGASAFYGGKASHGHHHEKPVISPPTNFEHTLHVGFDPTTGEFTGMPKNWYLMLKNSNISKTEQKKNPQAVIEVLKWYESKDKDKGFKYMTMGECETSNLFPLFLVFPQLPQFLFSALSVF